MSVSVPVLSELIADVEPSVSTERSRFTIAPGLGELRSCPIDRIVVTTAGRPVGIAETENAIAVRNSMSNGVSRHSPIPIETSERDAGDDQDLVGQRVQLAGERA